MRRDAITDRARLTKDVAVGQIVDHTACGAHGHRAEHEDDHHFRRGMRSAGDPDRPQHRHSNSQMPMGDARELDEIAHATRVAVR
jgi:hypothetical protein